MKLNGFNGIWLLGKLGLPNSSFQGPSMATYGHLGPHMAFKRPLKGLVSAQRTRLETVCRASAPCNAGAQIEKCT